jgi:quinol monooxygenase YgiN
MRRRQEGVESPSRGVVSADGEAYAYDYGRFLQDLYLVEGLRQEARGPCPLGRTRMRSRPFLQLGGAILSLSLSGGAAAQEAHQPLVRMAELEINPAQLESYKAAVKEEMETSVRVEPGVLAIYAVAEADCPSRLRFFELYADEAAYKAHIESAHFRKYFETTRGMITSRKLIDTVPILLSAKKK